VNGNEWEEGTVNRAQPACCTAGLSQTPENNKSPKSAPLISNLLVIREYRHENRIYCPCLIKKELTRGEERRGEAFFILFSPPTFWSQIKNGFLGAFFYTPQNKSSE